MTTPQHPTGRTASPNPGLIFELMIAPIRLAVLESALDMNMADVLAEQTDLEAIAHALNVETTPANLRYFLDAMTATGFAEKKNGAYCNTPFAEAYMRKNSPSYLGEMLTHLCRMQHRNLPRIPDLIRQGPPEVKQRDDLHGEKLWKESVRHLACYQKAGMADVVADLLAGLPEFPSMKRMLDMGCGPGIMCMTTVSRHPSMKGVLCDLPQVMEVAREEIAAAGMTDRIATIDGDYNEVDFGKDYDLIWASHTLYYAKDLDAMFSKVHDALVPGGVFVSFHEGLTCERTQPAGMVLSRLSLALEGQDVSFEQGQIASHLPGAGFASVETRTLEQPMGPIELVVARKRS